MLGSSVASDGGTGFLKSVGKGHNIAGMSESDSSHSRDEIVERLRAVLPELRDSFGVCGLSVFGSQMNGEAKPDSDVDILVEFDRVPGFFKFIQLEQTLTGHLGLKVDLVMKTALRPSIGQRILADAVTV